MATSRPLFLNKGSPGEDIPANHAIIKTWKPANLYIYSKINKWDKPHKRLKIRLSSTILRYPYYRAFSCRKLDQNPALTAMELRFSPLVGGVESRIILHISSKNMQALEGPRRRSSRLHWLALWNRMRKADTEARATGKLSDRPWPAELDGNEKGTLRKGAFTKSHPTGSQWDFPGCVMGGPGTTRIFCGERTRTRHVMLP